MPDDDYAIWLASKHAAQRITWAQLTPLVTDVCGDEGLGSAQQVVVGHSSVVFDVPRADGGVIVRAKVSEAPHYEAERWARSACHEVGVPAPEVLGLRHVPLEQRWLSVCVERRSPGRPFLEVLHELGPEHPRCRVLGSRMGAMLARLHSIETDGYGPLDGRGRGQHAAYAGHVVDAVTAAAERLVASDAAALVDVALVRTAAEEVLTNVTALDPPRPSLVHMDAGADHVFVEGDDVVGVIDLEAVEGADPVFAEDVPSSVELRWRPGDHSGCVYGLILHYGCDSFGRDTVQRLTQFG